MGRRKSRLLCAGAVMFAALAASAPPAGAAATFLAPELFPAAISREALAAADFNRDGRLDVALGGYDVTSVLLGRADGFGPARDYPTPNFAAGVVPADLNGDGALDLAMPYPGSPNALLYGDGDGAFAPPATLTTGAAPWDLVLPDLDGDARADIAAVDTVNDNVTVRMNTGAGTFAAATTRPAGDAPRALVAGRFAGNDAAIDLAVANHAGGTVTVLQNNGSGGTTTAATVPVLGNGPHDITSGDLNHDGRADLVTANDSSDVTVILNTAGGFVAQPPIPLGAYGHRLALGDVNGDDHPDIVIGAIYDNRVVIVEGAGDGSFGSPQALADSIIWPADVAVRDLDADGTGDLLVASIDALAVVRSAGVATLSATQATFGTQAQATLSPAQSITITNDGTAPLRIDGVRLTGAHPGDFAADRGTCDRAVAPGGTCALSVRFTPQAAGTRTATLGLTGHAANAAAAAVALTGTGGELPTGPVGPIGATGQPGPIGGPGPQGAVGPPGATGPAGRLVLVAYEARAAGRGLRVRYALTHAARVRLSVTAPGGKRSTVRASGRAGRNTITWKSGKRRPRGGRYRLTLTAERDGKTATERRTIRVR